MKLLQLVAGVTLLSLAACTSEKAVNFVDSGSDTMTADDIKTALAGKTFSYAGAGVKGTIIYAEDGTSLYTEDGKGNGTGKWHARDGQLCQSLDPASFIPSGKPESCAGFTRSGSGYAAGPVTLTNISG